ncbi:MAG TPA: acetylglutamate kinase, partial [Nocardioides sp.]|nr:acetylglutamate kinase [Nocardioides sp.]
MTNNKPYSSQTAETLANALPWLMKYHGKVVVVKYGGNAMTDDNLKKAFAEDIAFLRFAGFRPVVVHGGGPQISTMLDKLGIKS